MSKKINKTAKKIVAFALSLLLIISCTVFYNNFGIKNDSTVKAASTDTGNIKVLLSTMASLKTIDITVNGTYSIRGISNENYAFRNGVLLRKTTYTFSIAENNIVLSCAEGEFVLGSDITLYSHEASRDGYLTMRNKSYGTCNYIGNMRIYISSGYLVFINELNIDDYLCGVVPYEMSNGQALESLKVQAVCARSYAYNLVIKKPTADWHVNDTTSTQVYKGYKEAYTKCIAAVDQTAYQVLTYNGSYISTYYSSSNGGLTESTAHAWVSNLPYYTVKVDEYDTAYQNRRYTLSKTSISSSNISKLKTAAKSNVKSRGYDYDTLEILSVNHIIPTYYDEPVELEETDRRVASIEVQITVKAKNTSTGEYETFECSVFSQKESLRSFLYFVNPDGIDGRVLSSTRFKVEETDTQIIVTCNGNGHGVGMSQNGVYARVKAGQTYTEILSFYFTGTQIKTLRYETYIFEPVPAHEYLDTQADTVTLYDEPKSGIINASTLVYENAGTIYNLAGSADADTEVTIVGEADDWYAVSTKDDSVTGYIMKKYITLKTEPETPVEEEKIMKVGIVTNEVWARSSAEYTEENLLKKLNVGSEVIVLDETSVFYEIYYNESPAYVSKEYVQLTDETVYSISKAQVNAYKVNLFSKADEESEKNGYLSEGAEIEVFNISYGFAGCIYNGTISYVKSDKIDIIEDKYGYAVPRESNAIDVNLKVTSVTNVYESADGTGEAIDELQSDDIVRAVVLNDSRYKIVYGNDYAYISSDDTVVYSDNVTVERVVALADKILYSSPEMLDAIGILSSDEALEIASHDGNIITAYYNGTLCYMTNENLTVRTEQATVVK